MPDGAVKKYDRFPMIYKNAFREYVENLSEDEKKHHHFAYKAGVGYNNVDGNSLDWRLTSSYSGKHALHYKGMVKLYWNKEVEAKAEGLKEGGIIFIG